MKRAWLIGFGVILAIVVAVYVIWEDRSVQQSLEQEVTAQSRNEDLLGEWSLYMDCPNTIFIFREGGAVELVSCDGDGLTSTEVGTYTVAGKSFPAVFPESGDYSFEVVYEGNEQELQLTRFDQKFTFFKVQR